LGLHKRDEREEKALEEHFDAVMELLREEMARQLI
jgi:hypothetical protein